MRRVTRLLAVLVAVALLGTGCRSGSGPDDPAASPTGPTGSPLPVVNAGPRVVPDGWVVHTAAGYSFAYPKEWVKTERDTRDTHVVEVNGPKGEGELPRQVVVAAQPDFTGDLAGLVTAFEYLRTLPEQVVVRDERVTIDGAAEAQLTERTWQAPSVAGKTPARALELRVITPDRLSVGFVVRSAESEFEAARLREVFASFRLG